MDQFILLLNILVFFIESICTEYELGVVEYFVI